MDMYLFKVSNKMGSIILQISQIKYNKWVCLICMIWKRFRTCFQWINLIWWIKIINLIWWIKWINLIWWIKIYFKECFKIILWITLWLIINSLFLKKIIIISNNNKIFKWEVNWILMEINRILIYYSKRNQWHPVMFE